MWEMVYQDFIGLNYVVYILRSIRRMQASLGPLLLSHPGSTSARPHSGAGDGRSGGGITIGPEQGEVGADFSHLGSHFPTQPL